MCLQYKYKTLFLFMFLVQITTISEIWANTGPVVSVNGNTLEWSPVQADAVNIHRGDDSYLETLPGTASSWTAPESGTYYLVVVTGADWRNWLRSETVTVGGLGVQAPMPVVSGNQLNWPAVSALSINVHHGDGSYLDSLPGNATFWSAPASGSYYLVATNIGDWSNWLRSETVTVGAPPSQIPVPVVNDNQLNWSVVTAMSINVHRADGSYITSLPGNATSWTAPDAGGYYLVAVVGGDWRNWVRSETVIVAGEVCPQIPGAVVSYPFNANALDTSGANNHGFVDGATLVDDRFGNPNSAYWFDGDRASISIGPAGQAPFPLTISIWFNAADDRFGHFFANDDANDANLRWGIGMFITTSGRVGANTYEGFSAPQNRTTYTAVTENLYGPDEWHHFVMVFNANRDRVIYVDGVEYTGAYLGSGRGMTYSGGNGLIGRMRANSAPKFQFLGAMDDIQVFNRALTTEDVVQLFNLPQGCL